MLAHHQETIARLTAHFQSDPAALALIIGGSVAKGLARPDSDIDFVLVVSDDDYAQRAEQNAFHFFSRDFTDYPGGYVDGKIVDVPFLREVADQGSEPARAAFASAFITFSREPAVNDLLPRIPVYPENEHRAKIQSFYAQVLALQWYVGEAEKRRDPYLMMHVISNLVLFGGRMILAHNRILYPYHKWFMTELRRAPQKPDNLMERIDVLLAEPTKTNADAFCESVLNFVEWDQPPESWPVRFMRDSEWNWRNGCRPPLADW
jgi:hypothetical protein